MLGGTQSLHTNSYDEALALPTEEAVRIALRTQQVIAHESGVTNTIDPLGGSYFVETLTDEMERAAYEYFARIDELGGMVEAIKQNFPQREIADASFRYQHGGRRARSGSWSASTSTAHRRGGGRHPPHRPRARAQAGRAAGGDPRPARLGRGGADAGGAEAGGRHRREPDAADPRRARARASEGEMVAALQEVFGDLHRAARASEHG